VQVKTTGEYPKGAKSLVPTRRPFHGAGLLVWKDEGTFARLERAELVSGAENSSYVNWELRRNKKFARVGGSGEMDVKNDVVWLQIERRGDKLYGSGSADGMNWKSLAPIDVELPPKLLVGVAAGHNTSSGYEPVFEDFRLFRAVDK
jgi:hypothetical protein